MSDGVTNVDLIFGYGHSILDNNINHQRSEARF